MGCNVREKNKSFKKCFCLDVFISSEFIWLLGWLGLVLETGFHSRLGWPETLLWRPSCSLPVSVSYVLELEPLAIPCTYSKVKHLTVG